MILSYDIESAKKKVHLLELHIKPINFLFYNYVFNSSKTLSTFRNKSVIPSFELFDKQYHNMSFFISYQPSFIYYISSLLALGLVSLPWADKGYDMKKCHAIIYIY
jgi:hypothetical protein